MLSSLDLFNNPSNFYTMQISYTPKTRLGPWLIGHLPLKYTSKIGITYALPSFMETKKLESLRKRIIKANRSLSVMGEMLLRCEIDAANATESEQLRNYLASKGVQYGCLDKSLKRNAA